MHYVWKGTEKRVGLDATLKLIMVLLNMCINYYIITLLLLYYIIYYIINIFTGFRLNTFITKKNGLYCAWLFLQPLKNSLYASGF